MIKTKEDLRYYLEQDRIAFHKPLPTFKNRLVQFLFPDRNWQFMRVLRRLEYHINNPGILHKLYYYYYARRHARLRSITGIEISPNSVGAGLHVSHGKCVVGATSKIGEHCLILSDTTVGSSARYDCPGLPKIGNRVVIASGARIIGNITIADDVVIGANAVVTKDILEPGTTWAGIPARKVSDKGSAMYLREEFRK